MSVTVSDNFVGHVRELSKGTYAAYALCSIVEGGCNGLKVTNNIAAGAPYAGFVAPAHDCGDYSQTKFRGNVAHSINGASAGIGALIFPDTDASHSVCFEGSYFSAYKCKY